MKVVARSVDWDSCGADSCPPDMRPYTVRSQTLLTVGTEYDVHALVVFKGHPVLLVVDDRGWPDWCASWLFDTTDGTLPSDWICTVLHDEPSLLVGPEFIAKDEQGYGSMVELDADQVDRFWNRVRVRQLGGLNRPGC